MRRQKSQFKKLLVFVISSLKAYHLHAVTCSTCADNYEQNTKNTIEEPRFLLHFLNFGCLGIDCFSDY